MRKHTRKNFLELWLGDEFISQHVELVKAGDAAEQHGPGTYSVIVDGGLYYEIDVPSTAGIADGSLTTPAPTPNSPPRS